MNEETLRTVLQTLDQIEVAACVFDARDCAVMWNHTFLLLFPEHSGHIGPGEHYSENLRRFYRHRLGPDEAHLLEQYVEEGIQRHRNQHQPFEFDHRGQRLRVASLAVPAKGRVRVWRKAVSLAPPTEMPSGASRPGDRISAEVADALESLADGALVADAAGTTLWANRRFFEAYRLSPSEDIAGLDLAQVYQAAWRGQEPTEDFVTGFNALKERRRFAGAPFELALPGRRWVRVVEQLGGRSDGRGYSTHVDITALKQQQDELQRLTARFESLSVTDSLTGLANRRRFDEALKLEWLRARRNEHPLSLIVIDIDHFKHVNDDYGHPCGDDVLRATAALLSQHVKRAGDLVARYGGEEFAVLLPDTPLAVAHEFAERLRLAVEALPLNAMQQSIAITISCGVSCALAEVSPSDPEWLVHEADAALYEAKRSGRNRVVSR